MEHLRGLLRPTLWLITALASSAAVALVSAASAADSSNSPRDLVHQTVGHELPRYRTRSSDTFVTETGTFVTRSYGAPVNYRDGEHWKRIDNSLQASSAPGYAFTNAANSYHLALPEALDGRPVKVSDSDAWVSFSLRGAQGGQGVTSGSVARYPDVLPGVDASYAAQAESVKEQLTLASEDARSNYTFDVDASAGLEPRERDDGGIDFVDSDGRAQLAFEAPSMTDAAGKSSDAVSMKLARAGSGYTVTLSADREWLRAEERQYPVAVDPTTTSVNPTEDCYIVGGTQASSHFCGSAANELNVGTDASGNPNRAYARFDTSAVPKDAEVLEGQFHLHVDSGTQRQVDVHHLTHDSTSQRTWNTYDGTNSWTPGGEISSSDGSNTSFGGTAGWYVIDARKLVRDWVDKSTSNYGVLLKDTGSPASLMQISASEQASFKPFLEIEWANRTGIQDRWTFEDQRLSDRMLLKTNVANGNLILQESDVHIPGTAGEDLDFKRFWNSREVSTDSQDDLGRYWRMGTGYDVWLKPDSGDKVQNFDGPSDFWAPYDKNADGSYTTPTGMNADLKKNADNTFTLTYRQSHKKLEFSSIGELTAEKDRNDNKISFAYNGSGGKLLSIKDSHDQGTANNTLSFAYNGSGWVSTITDRANPQRTWQYGYTGNLMTSYTNPDGKITRYAYDANENLTDITDPRGNVTHMTYDSLFRVTSIRRWTDAAHTVGPLTQYSYPANLDTTCTSPSNSKIVGETIETDPNGNTIKYCWDNDQRVLRTEDGRGKKRNQSYTANSDVQSVSSATNQAWQLQYDGDSRVKSSTAPPAANQASGLSESYGYDPAIADKSDPRFWLQSTLTDPQNHSYDYDYDSKGNLTDVTDGLPSQNNIHIVPNSDGTTASVRDANGTGTTGYGYTNGDRTSIDRPAPLGDESFTYDAAHPHTVKTATDGRGKVTTYTYDPLDRPTTIAYSDGTSVTYGYDDNGNLTSRTDATGQTTYVYDRLNRLSQENFPGGKTNIYTYDANGNLKTLQDAGGTTTYNYGASNLLDSMQAPGDAAATTYTYSDDNQRKTTNYPNGVVMTATWEDGTTGNEGPGRLKRIKAVKGTTTISDFTYSYLNAGVDTALRQSVTNKNNVTTTYSYDALNRLKTASNVNGVDNYTYTYDGNGNMKSRLKNSTTTSYGYDNANELCWNGGGAQSSSACSPVPTGMTTWTYDNSGEALTASTTFSASYNARQQTTSMNTIVGGTQVPFTYAGSNQFERATAGGTSFVNTALGVGAETSGTSTTYYRRDNGGGLASERLPSGATYYYVFDGLGSVVAVTDSAGTAQDTYTYDPYGGTAVTGTVANPWRYASAYQDSTGFYKMGMRYYNTLIQRWTQPDSREQPTDPLRGDRYAYAGDDPINNVDASGQDFPCILFCDPSPPLYGRPNMGGPSLGESTWAIYNGLYAAGSGCIRGLPVGSYVGSLVGRMTSMTWAGCAISAGFGLAGY